MRTILVALLLPTVAFGGIVVNDPTNPSNRLQITASGEAKVVGTFSAGSDSAVGPLTFTGTTCTGADPTVQEAGCKYITNPSGGNAWSVDLRGTFTATIEFEGSVDGVTWMAVKMWDAANPDAAYVTSATAPGAWVGNVAGFIYLRARASAYTSSPTLEMRASTAMPPVKAAVTSSGLTDAELRATPVPVSGTFWQATQPVSGTLTCNAGTGPFPVSDNGGSLTIDNTTLAVIGGGTQDAALRVTVATDSTGVLSVDDNGGSLTVDGPLTDAQLRATPVPISDGASSITVDGTVAAVQSGTWTSVIYGAAKGTSVLASPTVANVDANTNALDVYIRGGAGSGGTATADGTAWAYGTTQLTPMGAVYDTTYTAPTDGDVSIPRIDVDGNLRVNVVAGGAGDGKILDGTAAGQADVIGSAPAGTEQALAVRQVGSVAVTGPLTDTELRATAVPVSGTLTCNAGTGPFPVSDNGGSLTVDGTFWQATQPISAASLPLPTGAATSAKQPALGTAGTASADVITVQGIASMTPLLTTATVSGTVVTNAVDNEPVNVAQMNGVAVTMGNGASGTGVQRVTLASDSTGQVALSTAGNTVKISQTGDENGVDVLSAPGAGTVGSAHPATAVQMAGTDGTNLTRVYVDPCQREAKSRFVVNTTGTTPVEVGAAVASEFYYVCSIVLVATGGANTVNLIEDDTATNCPSPTAGLLGGTTAASGLGFADKGGITMGDGSHAIMRSGTAQRSLCIVASAATQVSGHITYVSAP